MESLDFIMHNSETAQQYENVTVMAWAHSNLNKNTDCYMSSKDLHFQQKMAKRFQNVQAMVVQVSGNHIKNYDLVTYENFAFMCQELTSVCAKCP